MSQVTNTPLAELQAQLTALVERRQVLIEQAERTIKTANREFDKEALKLGREINRLRAIREAAEPTPPKPTTTPAPARKRREAAKPMLNMDGMTPDEIEHFTALLNKKG